MLNVLESLLHATAMIGVLILGAVYMTVVWLLDGESEGTKSFMWLASCLVGVAYLFSVSPWLAAIPPALLLVPFVGLQILDKVRCARP